MPQIGVTAQRRYFDDTGRRWLQMGQEQTDSHGNFRIPVMAGEYRIQTRYTPLDRTTGEAVLPVTITGDGSSGGSGAFRVGSGEERHFELRPAMSPTHSVTAYAGSGASAGGGGGFCQGLGASERWERAAGESAEEWDYGRGEDAASPGNISADGGQGQWGRTLRRRRRG